MQTQDIISKMFSAGAHFGYSRSRRHPSAKDHIFGVKNNVEIFDLEKTSPLLEEAKAFMRTLGRERKTVLYCGGKNEAREVVKEYARSIEMPFVVGRWIGGTLTNFPQIRSRVDRLEERISQRDGGELNVFTKRERLEVDREIEKLEGMFGGLRPLTKKPDAILIVDTRHEHTAVREARLMGIPIIGVINSDCNAWVVDYPVIGNDATVKSISFFVQELTDAYREGLNEAPQQDPEAEAAKDAVAHTA